MIAAFDSVAKWYGAVIGLVDVTARLDRGVTGLLGPNGAGKSTFLKLLTGQLSPSQGSVRLLEEDPFRHPRIHARIGFLPEQDAFYEEMTGFDFVHYLVRLHGFRGGEARRRAGEAVERVGLTADARRRIRGYSKGMRQRIKLAQAIAHRPEVLVLDEPMTGMDPLARRSTQDLVREMAEAGASVLVSSHILHEVEAMTRNVLLLYQGRVLAQGTIEEIRSLLSRFPHKIVVRSPRSRDLARALLDVEGVVGVHLEDGSLHVDARQPEAVYDRLPRLVLEEGIPIESIDATDASLEAVFRYLVR